MHRFIAEFNRPPADLVARLQAIPVSVISDAMGRQGVPAGLAPLSPALSLAGPALTVKVTPGDNLAIHAALGRLQPGDVLVVDGGGFTAVALFGEMMALTAQRRGAAGVVIDGAVRDRTAVVDLGLPVYSRAVTPAGPFKDSPGSIGVPVSCGGVPVLPGDIVIGDGDGVVVVPQDLAPAIAAAAEVQAGKEAQMRERILRGELPYDFLGLAEVLRRLGVSRSGD